MYPGTVPLTVSERNSTHMVIVEALVKLGVTEYDHNSYKAIADTVGVAFRVVRRTHEAYLPMILRMIQLERELLKSRAEYMNLKYSIFPETDNPVMHEMGDESIEVGPNMEHIHMEQALRTVEAWIAMQKP